MACQSVDGDPAKVATSTTPKPPHDRGLVAAVSLAGWVAVLVATQMLMLICTKRATDREKLPLLLCVAQFATSVVLAGGASGLSQPKGRALPWMDRGLAVVIVSLSVAWTAGFVFFNASAALMSPAVVNLVRCMEPLATVCVGLMLGERYTLRVLATLIPICGGVLLASFKGGTLSVAGIFLAALSNVSFCCRPYFTQRLKQLPNNKLDSLGVFFNVTFVSTVVLPIFVVLLEGGEILPALRRLTDAGALAYFCADVMLSSVFFFLYQFTQLLVMSKLTPLGFSVLTPVVKALMIVVCSLYFGDPFGLLSALGVVISTGGGYLFTVAKSADTKKEKTK